MSPAPSPRPQLRSLLAVLHRRRRLQLWWLLALMLLGAVADLFAIGSLVPFLAVLAGPGTSALPDWLQPTAQLGVAATAMLFAACALLAGAIRLALTWATQSFAIGAGHDVACEVQRRVLLQPYSYHLQQHSSSAVAALQKVEELVWSVLLPLVEGAVALVIGSAILLLLLLINPLAAVLAGGAVLALYALVILLTRPALRRAASVMNRGWDERARLIGDSLGGVRDIILDGSHPLFLDLFRCSDARLASARARVGVLAAVPRFTVEAVGLALIALAAVLLSRGTGSLTEALPLLGALALAAQRLLPLLQQLYRGWAALTSRGEVLGDVYRLLTLPLPPSEPGQAVPFEREIRLEGVSFRYEVRERPVLGAVDLTLRKGERVALTGRTGSGKSTLADLVMGLLPPTEGVIRVDGRMLAAADLPGWRRNVAHVPQAIFLIDDSLLANIAFGVPEGEIDPGRARAAAEVAQLGDLIAELPDGLSTTVGERGVRLSGGQRQRLGLARAIYRRAPLLVLDEATNALDPATEAAVVRSLDELQASGVTILIIAHRASALEGCDRVFHLADGRVRSAEPVPA